MKTYKTFWMVGKITTKEGKQYTYKYQVTDRSIELIRADHLELEITKVHQLVNLWMKPDRSDKEDEFVYMYIDSFDNGIEQVTDITWKEITESPEAFEWDLYCLEVEGRWIGLGYDWCIENGEYVDFSPMK